MTPSLVLAVLLAPPPVRADTTRPDPARLPGAVVSVHPDRREIVIELPAIPLPAHTGHHGDDGGGFPPVVKALMPIDASIYGFRVDLVDAAGRELPAQLVHHFNLIDPSSRELFLPISRRVLAAGKETGAQRLPRLLFGLPIERGTLLVASAMLHNPTDEDYEGVRTRLVLEYVPGGRWYPLFDGFPFQLDVAFPVGDKSFALPPGRSARSYEGRPSVPGKVVAIGGHMHEMGTRIELTEVESGKVIWSAEPSLDADRNVVGIPVNRLYGFFRVGVPLHPDRTYRVTVHYDNPTGTTIDGGGMGVLGGLFVPDRGVTWPRVNANDPLYVQDARHYLRIGEEIPKAPAPAAHRHH